MVFVTGASGLVGSHILIQLLKAGKKVRALRRPGSPVIQATKTLGRYHLENRLENQQEKNPNIQELQWVDGDLNDVHLLIEMLQNCTEVYHCAALVSFDPKDKELLFQTNAVGTENMVNAALAAGIKKFCHVSSVATLGSSEKEISEESPWKSSPETSIYAISKYAAEREVFRGMEEGLPSVIVNPSIILGPGNWKTGSSQLFSRAHKGMKFFTAGSSGFVDVRDLAAIMVKLMNKNTFGGRFIVSAENLTYKNFFDLLCSALNRPVPAIEAGQVLSILAQKAEQFRSSLLNEKPLLTRETVRTALKQKRYANAKIKSELGFEFMPIQKTIEETCRLFQSDLLSA